MVSPRWIAWLFWIGCLGCVLVWQLSKAVPPQATGRAAGPLAGLFSWNSSDISLSSQPSATSPSDLTHLNSTKKRAAILMYGRIGDRHKESKNVSDREDVLVRLREELLTLVVAPNAEEYDFTVVIRAEQHADQDAVRRVWGSAWAPSAVGGLPLVRVYIADAAMNLTIQEPSVFGCQYFMWSNIEVGVQKLLSLDLAPEWVMVLRTDVHIASTFQFQLLNSSLLYVANACSPIYIPPSKRSLPREKIVYRSMPCQPGDPRPAPSGQVSEEESKAFSLNANLSARASPCEHRVKCMKFYPQSGPTVHESFPDYYLLGSMETVSRMFRNIVEDWHAGVFRKSRGHCNHGVLGARVWHLGIPIGRYKYQSADITIPRFTSWYPAPSLNRRLEQAGMLVMNPPAYDLKSPRELSECQRMWMCNFEGSNLFNT